MRSRPLPVPGPAAPPAPVSPPRLTSEDIAALAVHEQASRSSQTPPAHSPAPAVVRPAYRNQARNDVHTAAQAAGLDDATAARAANDAAPQVAAARSLADSGIGKALPKLKLALADLPARIKSAAIERGKRGGDHRSPSLPPSSSDVTLDPLAEALSQDLPGTNWRNGQDGVLDAPWATDADLLPDLLPIAITGAHGGFDGNHRTATFEAASDTQLLALGVGQADLANIRAGLERSPHHAARAIDDAFARLDANSDTARASQAELTADHITEGQPTITVQPDSSFRVDDADGNEVGTATTPEGAQRLVDSVEGITNRSDLFPGSNEVQQDENPADPNDESYEDPTEGGTVIHERRAKFRKKNKNSKDQDWDNANNILERVVRKAALFMSPEAAKKQVPRKMLFSKHLTPSPEERLILDSRYEILLVYSADGRLQKGAIGTREQSDIPLLTEGDILTHNHPKGRGPCDSDIGLVLNGPNITLRIVARNELGRTEIFQIRRKKTVSKETASRIMKLHKDTCDKEGDDHAATLWR